MSHMSVKINQKIQQSAVSAIELTDATILHLIHLLLDGILHLLYGLLLDFDNTIKCV